MAFSLDGDAETKYGLSSQRWVKYKDSIPKSKPS